jgi:hypothetical protein
MSRLGCPHLQPPHLLSQWMASNASLEEIIVINVSTGGTALLFIFVGGNSSYYSLVNTVSYAFMNTW